MAIPLNLEPAPAAGAGDLSALRSLAPELLQPLLEAIPARVVILDDAEHLVWANQYFFSFTRLHPKQVLGRHIAQIIGAETRATYDGTREPLLRGETVCWEGWTELAAVGKRYMREHLVPRRDSHGRLNTIIISLDWTELKLREAELQAQVQAVQRTEALKASIVDHALAALITTDERGVIAEFNPAAESMFGLRRQQVLGRPVAEVVIPPQHRAAHNEGMARIASGGLPRILERRLELPALRADGSEFPVEMVLWRTAVGGTTYFTASLVDLTERKTAAEQIDRQREALRQSEKLTAMGSLLAGVAHELNNPLSIVMGRASLLEDKMAGTEHADDALRIREAAERCGRIVRTFLNMARSRAPQRGPVQLNDLVTAAVEMLQYGLRSHGIAVRTELDAALPLVLADSDQVGQVVLNLLVNAQQALAASEPPRHVTLRTLRHDQPGSDDQVWLQIEDSGPGVSDALRDRIFEPFFTTKPEGIGTGLGLAVSRSIAREHGGDLIVEPKVSARGATFVLRLPINGAEAPEAPPPAAAALDGDVAARVLVVDDEAEITDLMRDFLEAAGFEVATAESGAVALELLTEARFDAIVSDLRMPDIDGATLWREVGARWPAMASRVLFVTGDTLSPGARSFLAETGRPMLDKPFTKADLLTQVRAILASAQSSLASTAHP